MTMPGTRTLLISFLIAAGFFAASPAFAQVYVGGTNTGYGSGAGISVPYTSPYTTPSYYGNYNQNYYSQYYPWDYYCLYYGGYYCHGGNSSGLSITNVSGPNSLAVGQQGTWSVTTSAPANSYVSVSVNWGDQGYAYPAANAASQVTQQNTFSHAYNYAGTYTITFTARDSAGRSNTSTATVQVGGSGCTYNCGGQISFTASPTSGQAPLGVSFTASNVSKDSTYYINYGDGTDGQMTLNPSPLGACYYGSAGCTITYSASASHTYSQAGTYTAQLTEQPSYSCPPGAYCTQMMPAPQVVGTVTITVTGSGGGGGPLSITGIDAPAQLSAGQSGTWTVRVNTSSQYLYYSVNWGDQNFYAPQTAGAQTVSVSGTFTHTYSQAGTYSPTFTVTDGSGHSVSSSATVIVSGDTCGSGGCGWLYQYQQPYQYQQSYPDYQNSYYQNYNQNSYGSGGYGTGYMDSGYYTNGYNYGFPTEGGYIPGYGCTGPYCPR